MRPLRAKSPGRKPGLFTVSRIFYSNVICVEKTTTGMLLVMAPLLCITNC